MITLTRKDADTWVITTTDPVLEVDAEEIRQLRAALRNAPRLPIPPPPDPPPVVVEVPVPVQPTAQEAATIALNSLGLPNLLSLLFTGKTAAQIQALVQPFLSATPSGGNGGGKPT